MASTKYLNSGSTTKVNEPVPEGMKLRTRVILFGLFVGVTGFGLFSYQLTTDVKFLEDMSKKTPGLVLFLAPYLGLSTAEVPVNVTDDPNDPHVAKKKVIKFPAKIDEIVGESVKILCILRSGKVVIVEASVNDDALVLQNKAIDKIRTRNPNYVIEEDPIVNVDVVNEEDAEALLSQSEDDLERALRIKIPVLPSNATKKELNDVLDKCYALLGDVSVQEQLSLKYTTDVTQIRRTKQELEATIAEIEKRTKKSSWRFW